MSTTYAKLCLAVGKTIRTVAPHELFVGPATSEFDLRFLDHSVAAGCLPVLGCGQRASYRHRPPETAADDYRILRDLICPLCTHSLPMVGFDQHPDPYRENGAYSSGGWGAGYDEPLQGRYLAREFLTNLANDIRVSVWYDWHEDGTDAKEGEHHFGSVRFAYQDGHPEVYEPKPAFNAARTLTTPAPDAALQQGHSHWERTSTSLLFSSDTQIRVVAWCSAGGEHTVVVPASPGRFHAIGHLGAQLPTRDADASGLRLTLTPGPGST